MRLLQRIAVATLLCTAIFTARHAMAADQDWITYEGKAGPGKGKHIVFLAGDEEYRSEEALPMLAKILSQRHGFKCTVLFSVDDDGTINPNKGESLTHPEALDSADAIVMLLRFRHWSDDASKRFEAAVNRGVPIIGLRTSTHAFNGYAKGSPWEKWNYNKDGGFGKAVFGETWVSHWGKHKSEATRGVIEASAVKEDIMQGVGDLFGTTDVYEANPPADSKILVRGQILKGMNPTDAAADYRKARADKKEQAVNDPMMPVAWTREVKNDAGKVNRVFCTTMAAASDLVNEDLRRLVVNAVYWGLKLKVPAKANVEYVDDYQPTFYGFNGYRRGLHVSDNALGKVLPGGQPVPIEPKKTSAARPAPVAATSGKASLEIKPGEHVAFIGNALADRMQFDGWLETFITSRLPQHNLVFRNLAVAGDEVANRARSENFGTPQEWLTKVQADVIFAFFGFNESFGGDAGLDQFKGDLDKFLKETKAANYSGRGAPRIVLFSPIANERHRDPNLPDPAKNNANLKKYTAAMAEVAAANQVPFVDLFTPSQQVFADAARAGQSLTVNGLYLTEAANKLVAQTIFQSLFNDPAPSGDVEKLRSAINEKNWQWHQRYRTVDGYNVFGGRSQLAYQPGKPGFINDRNAAAPYISNFQVMQQEMSQRDVITANRDKRVWAVARGGDLPIDDSNLPAVAKVGTNKPGAKDDGSYVFLGAEEAIGKMKVHSGMKVNLFASEEKFPELANPVQMAWDTKGRLWVAAWRNYPERTPDSKVGDSLLVFEDTDGDGKADKVTHFLDDLNCPTGFQFYKDGVLVMQAPDLWFVRDTNGDGKADTMERVLMGLDSADSHHTANSICHEPGGAIFLSDGVFHRSQVETFFGPVRNRDGAIYRYEPDTGKFETYVSYGFANPHGRVFDYWGNDIITDATGNASYFAPAFSGHIDFPAKHPTMKQFWNRPSRPCPGTGILSSRHFPEEFQGNFLNINVIGFQGVYRVKVSEEGSGLTGETLENLISSEDPNFRPSAISVGPDGALYFLDWHKPLIGHMQHHLRDPNRDHEHGRIYRITYEGRPLLKPKKIDGQPVPALLELLKEPENGVRELAKIELGKHDSKEVIAATKKWANGLSKSDKNYEHNLLEALWVNQWHNNVDVDLLKKLLRSPEPRARAAATHVLCYWRDRVPDALSLFRTQAMDESPRVRLEAIRAASFYDTAEAADVALAALKFPTDYYLDYCLTETMRQLEPLWRKAIAEGKPVAADNPAGINYLLKSLNTAELQKLPHTPGVLEVILQRPGVADADRAVALDDLAKARKTSRATALLNLLDAAASRDRGASANLARLLPWQLPDDLKSVRTRVAKLTETGNTAEVRPAAWAALAVADGSFDKVWKTASASTGSLSDLVAGIPMLSDPDFRAKAYDQVKPIVTGSAAAATGKKEGTRGRYVRIELPGKGTLTLAEVQVFSGGVNIAPRGKASQSTTEHGGDASRAIDGKTDGAYGNKSQTHTQENSDRPWWEVDLGSEQAIESIVVWNRTDGTLGKRLDGFTLAVLDDKRSEVFKKKGNPAPADKASFAIGGGTGSGNLRRNAIRALVSMGAQPDATFGALVDLITRGEDVTAAAQGIRTIPRASWPKEAAGNAAIKLVAWAKTIPAADRSSQDFVEALQTAGDLAGLLPEDKAADLRKDIKQIRVAVYVLRTVREQMRYDTPRLVVEAGKPFEIIIENDDFMPHNLLVTKPGGREKVGPLADTMQPEQRDKVGGRQYVPNNPEIIAATHLLEPGMRETLKLTAPKDESEHEYFCSFPGHWQVMWGKLIVTKDVDAYLLKNPVAPTAPAAGHEHKHFE